MRFRTLVGVTILTGFVLAASAPAQPDAGPGRGGPPAPRPSWEYKALTRAQIHELAPKESQDKLTDGLNKLGAEKWELVTVDAVPPGLVSMYLFKRPAGGGRRAAAEAPAAQPEAKREAKPDEFRIYRLKSANAVELAQILQKLFQGREEKVLRVIADPNTNSLLTAGTPEQQETVKVLIEQLDVLSDVKAEPKRK